MTLDKNTTIIPAFSAAVFAAVKALPPTYDKPIHSVRVDLMQKALDSYFFGEKMFIFKNVLATHCCDHWFDDETGHPILYLMPELEALTPHGATEPYKTKEEAIADVTARLKEWGFGDWAVRYAGVPERKVWIDDNEYEAHFNQAMRVGIAAKYGQEIADKCVRQRFSPCKGTRKPLVFLEDTALFNRLVSEGAGVWGRVRYREAPVQMTLPEGEEVTFNVLVGREHLLVDLTRHFFGEREFKKAKPFTMYVIDDANKETRSYSLMVQVAPQVLGYRTVEEAHEGLRKLAIELGHVQDALKINIIQTTQWSLADIEKLEADDRVQGPIMFRPLRP